jgi:putative phage-type endonuclease
MTETQQSVAVRRAAWLDDRRTAITGTDAGKIMGVAPPSYGGAMSVYLEKVGELPESPSTPWRDSGLRLERPILEWYADKRQVPLVFNAPYTLVRSSVHPLIGATLDAMGHAREGQMVAAYPVDAKNIRIKGDDWGEPETDEMPTYYAAQLVIQMAVTDAEFADLAVLFSGQDLLVYRLHRDRALEADVLERCLAFYRDHVEKRIPPAVDGSRDWGEYLKRRFRQATETVIAATDAENIAAQQLHQLQLEADRVEADIEYRKNLIKMAIGDNKAITGGQWKASWTQEKDAVGVDWEAIARNLDLKVALLAGIIGDDKRLALYTQPASEPATDVRTALIADLRDALIVNAAKKHEKVTRRGARKFHFNYKGQ